MLDTLDESHQQEKVGEHSEAKESNKESKMRAKNNKKATLLKEKEQELEAKKAEQ